MARRDLTNEEIEQMGRENPGSAAKYLRLRREEIEQEKIRQREEADKEEWIKAFVSAGGDPRDAQAAYRAAANERAQEAAVRAENTAASVTRRRASGVL